MLIFFLSEPSSLHSITAVISLLLTTGPQTPFIYTIKYPQYPREIGPNLQSHSAALRLIVWDVYNNSVCTYARKHPTQKFPCVIISTMRFWSMWAVRWDLAIYINNMNTTLPFNTVLHMFSLRANSIKKSCEQCLKVLYKVILKQQKLWQSFISYYDVYLSEIASGTRTNV